jgi:hypothetical protein
MTSAVSVRRVGTRYRKTDHNKFNTTNLENLGELFRMHSEMKDTSFFIFNLQGHHDSAFHSREKLFLDHETHMTFYIFDF